MPRRKQRALERLPIKLLACPVVTSLRRPTLTQELRLRMEAAERVMRHWMETEWQRLHNAPETRPAASPPKAKTRRK